MREIAGMGIELSGTGSELVFEPLPEDDAKRSRPDATRPKEALGWEPRVPARGRLRKTLGWFAERSDCSETLSPGDRKGFGVKVFG